MPRFIILTEGKSNPTEAKTATGVLRYRPGDVTALLDPACAGRTAEELLGTGGDIPFVAALGDAPSEADTLLIGIAPAGGGLPERWRAIVREAIERGMDVWSGLHFFLSDDPEFSALAARRGVELRDLRRPPEELTVARDLARHAPCHRVHTVGHDCSVGKMFAAVELSRALCDAGRDAEFIATGQTGILVNGWGVPADRVISDFVSGAVEKLVVEHQEHEFLVVEGQGSLAHPLYSGVTLSLLHGCAPQTLIMVFDPTREYVCHTDMPIPPLRELVALYERVAGLLLPSKVVGIAANTYGLSAGEAERVIAQTEDDLGLPAVDIARNGPGRLIRAILARHEELAVPEAPHDSARAS